MALKSLISPLIRPLKLLTLLKLTSTIPSAVCTCKSSNYLNVLTYSRNIATAKSIQATESNQAGYDEQKAKIVLLLNFDCAQDALPYYKLPVRTLLHIYKTTLNDQKNGYFRNRLYYISDRIKCPPSVLSKLLVKRTFIYSLSFEWLESSMNVLLEMGVSGDRILRDLWVFKYHHETIRERLQKVKDTGVENIYPWMVRCSEDILKRSITISQETKQILGDISSTQTYLAQRLNISHDAIEEICHKLPGLKTIRVTKAKPFLDFLIQEGFELQDIASKPRVLTASQKTVEQRLKLLRNLGLKDINLNILCRSRKHFKKYCESINSVSDDSV